MPHSKVRAGVEERVKGAMQRAEDLESELETVKHQHAEQIQVWGGILKNKEGGLPLRKSLLIPQTGAPGTESGLGGVPWSRATTRI